MPPRYRTVFRRAAPVPCRGCRYRCNCRCRVVAVPLPRCRAVGPSCGRVLLPCRHRRAPTPPCRYRRAPMPQYGCRNRCTVVPPSRRSDVPLHHRTTKATQHAHTPCKDMVKGERKGGDIVKPLLIDDETNATSAAAVGCCVRCCCFCFAVAAVAVVSVVAVVAVAFVAAAVAAAVVATVAAAVAAAVVATVAACVPAAIASAVAHIKINIKYTDCNAKRSRLSQCVHICVVNPWDTVGQCSLAFGRHQLPRPFEFRWKAVRSFSIGLNPSLSQLSFTMCADQ